MLLDLNKNEAQVLRDAVAVARQQYSDRAAIQNTLSVIEQNLENMITATDEAEAEAMIEAEALADEPGGEPVDITVEPGPIPGPGGSVLPDSVLLQ